jgi:hypothetical protein
MKRVLSNLSSINRSIPLWFPTPEIGLMINNIRFFDISTAICKTQRSKFKTQNHKERTKLKDQKSKLKITNKEQKSKIKNQNYKSKKNSAPTELEIILIPTGYQNGAPTELRIPNHRIIESHKKNHSFTTHHSPLTIHHSPINPPSSYSQSTCYYIVEDKH